tara:strand:- start:143 stop:247 length:105 start_codon:yes stop_codon:yes gene_type:complete
VTIIPGVTGIMAVSLGLEVGSSGSSRVILLHAAS